MMKFSWVPVFIFMVGLVLWIGRPCPQAPANTEEFRNFILIEYDEQSDSYRLISDLLERSECLEEILQNQCLKDSVIQRDFSKRVDHIEIVVNRK